MLHTMLLAPDGLSMEVRSEGVQADPKVEPENPT